MEFDGFDWDHGNRDKYQKHGVAIFEIEGLFGGDVVVGPDVRHSLVERRFRAVGITIEGRSLFVVFAWRIKDGQHLIRPVSAHYMHKKETESYEEDVP